MTPFYEPFWAYGGMARASAALCRALVARGHDVTVATALLGEGVPLTSTEGGVRVFRFRGPAAFARVLFPLARGLDRFLRAELGSFDVVHLQGHRNGLAVAADRALASAGRPWLLAPAGTFPHHGQYRLAKAAFDRLLGDRIVTRARALVAVSEGEARDLPRPARVIPNGVEAAGRAPDKAVTKVRPRLLFVGSDRLQKRGHLLPRLLSAVPEAEPGDRGARRLPPSAASLLRSPAAWSFAACSRATRSPRPTRRPTFSSTRRSERPSASSPSRRPSPVPRPSWSEGTAAASGMSVAGGCVVPPDDTAAMAAAVGRRLREPELALQEARSVAAFARSRLTWAKAAEAFERLYEELRQAA